MNECGCTDSCQGSGEAAALELAFKDLATSLVDQQVPGIELAQHVEQEGRAGAELAAGFLGSGVGLNHQPRDAGDLSELRLRQFALVDAGEGIVDEACLAEERGVDLSFKVDGRGAEEFDAVVVRGYGEGAWCDATKSERQKRADRAVDQSPLEREQAAVVAVGRFGGFDQHFPLLREQGEAGLRLCDAPEGLEFRCVKRAMCEERDATADGGGETLGDRQSCAGPDRRAGGLNRSRLDTRHK